MGKLKIDRTLLEYKKDKRIALLYTVLSFVVFVVLLQFNGYKIPTPPLPEQLLFRNAEMELIPVEIVADQSVNSGGSQGAAGTPSNDPLTNKPNPQTEQLLTNPNSEVAINSGKSKRTNTDEITQNTATTIMKSDNPFDSGGGTNHGNGSGTFGTDNGPGNGRGNGNGMGEGNGSGTGERIRLTNINLTDVKSNVDCTIKMRLSVNAEGNVVAVEVLPGTTTNNQTLIRDITASVKKQIKYNKRPNGTIERLFYTVKVKAS